MAVTETRAPVGAAADGGLLADAAAPERAARQSETYLRLVWRRFRRNKVGMAGGVIVVLLVAVAIFANFLAPYGPVERDSLNIWSKPQVPHFFGAGGFSVIPYTHPYTVELDMQTFQATYIEDESRVCRVTFLGEGWRYSFLGFETSRHLFAPDPQCPYHLLGSDGLGRDVLSRMVIGSRLTLIMAGLVVAISVSIGTIIGIVSGYYGGRVDHWLQRATELVLALPELPFFLALVAIIPPNTDPTTVFFTLAGILSALKWAQLSREVRGKTLALSSADYVIAAEAVGARAPRIVLRHILPNVMSHVVVATTLMVPQIILIETFFSFVGIGVQPPLVSWGLLLNAGKDLQNLGSFPWVLTPVLAILAAVLSFNMFGDGLRDAIDPYAD